MKGSGSRPTAWRVASLDLRGRGFLRRRARTRDPDIGVNSGRAGRAAHWLAMASISGCQCDPPGIAAPDLDFRRIHERIAEMWVGDNDPVSHRNKIGRAPHRPPASGPVANAPFRRAVGLESTHDVEGAIDPERTPTVDAVGQDGNGHVAGGYHAGAGDIA